MENLIADAITKNTPAYTQYMSIGGATVAIKGKQFQTHAILTKIYSDDYSRYVFFNGLENLDSLTEVFSLWDENGNFYLLDTSSVISQHENYASHRWVIYKDAAAQSTKKSFLADVKPISQDEKSREWFIALPDLKTEFFVKNFASLDEYESACSGALKSNIKMKASVCIKNTPRADCMIVRCVNYSPNNRI